MTTTIIIRAACIVTMAIVSTIHSCGTIITDGTILGMIPGMVGMLLTSVWATIAGLVGDGAGTTILVGILHGITPDGMAMVVTTIMEEGAYSLSTTSIWVIV